MYQKETSPDSPTKVFLFALPPYVSKPTLAKIIEDQGYELQEIAIDRHIEQTGTIKTQGILTFKNISAAISWVSDNKVRVILGNNNATIFRA